MRDIDKLTLKAFIAAICQQENPLSDNLQTQINSISQSLETRVSELRNIALNTPSLATYYQEARLYLLGLSAERSKGLNFPPQSRLNQENPDEINNISRDISQEITNLENLLETIENNLEKAPQILASTNPVATAKKLLKLITDN